VGGHQNHSRYATSLTVTKEYVFENASMTHEHHHHHHAPTNYTTVFALGIALNLAFVAVEITYGVWAHSLALVADAGHNFSDVLGLSVAWGASVLVKRQATSRHTYGMRRSSILAALFNAVLLLVAVGAIAWEALQRLSAPTPVMGATVIWVAMLGIAVNAGSAWLFRAGQKEDLNMRGAFLHLVADAVVSLGTALAGLLVLWTGWLWVDPVVSLGIAGVILWSTWGLLLESLQLALDAVPSAIDPERVQTYLASLAGVASVHDLHIWAMSTTETALTVHLVMPKGAEDVFLEHVSHELLHHFAIEHATIQVERGTANCVGIACI
jgi:cobalt-zinc-cadmium efflux system protein